MVTGGAYILMALLILGAMAWYFHSERMRARMALDRRLETVAMPGSAPIRPVSAVTVPERLAPLLAQAQVELTFSALQMMVGGMLAIVVVVLLIAGPAVALVMLVGLPMAALTWLQARARKRSEALIEGLPMYLDSVRQLQAVGNSLSQALVRALIDAPDIVQSYFAPFARRLAMGAPVAETLQQMADRLQVTEVSMIASAVRNNLRYGGSIATIFGNLANILRERISIHRELLAATSETKVSARVLIGMPLIAMVFLVAMNPAYIEFFISDPRGQNLSMVAIGLEGVGILIIRRMMRLAF